MATLNSVKADNPQWFARGNKRFFGDVEYRVLHGKATGDPYLVRKTSMWSDMFGRPKAYCWRVNTLKSTAPGHYKIGGLTDQTFADLWAVKSWLKTA